jgi:hypothetical protein
VHNSITKLVESQPDWLTVTVSDGAMRAALEVQARQFLQTEVDRGNQLRQWQWRGYSGQRAGGIAFGQRSDSALAQATGPEAARCGKRLWQAARHATRLDVQVTVRYDSARSSLAARAYEQAIEVAARANMPTQSILMVNSEGGETFYLGSAASEQRGRVYNKAAESPGAVYARCWRYEVQFRGEYASDACSRIFAAPDPAPVCAGMVHLWFTLRSISVPWPYGEGVVPRVSSAGQTDVDRRLRWLQLQVAPSVEWLRRRGYDERTRAALGLLDTPSDSDNDCPGGPVEAISSP